MESENKIVITVKTTVNLPVEKVWEAWTSPEDVIHWNFASDTWHCPKATNDLREGGRFTYRMEAKDGSFGFDFGGTYTKVVPNNLIEYTLDDERKVIILFTPDEATTVITENFEAETMNSADLQRTGWQAILDNFKKYAEGKTQS